MSIKCARTKEELIRSLELPWMEPERFKNLLSLATPEVAVHLVIFPRYTIQEMITIATKIKSKNYLVSESEIALTN